ncbi:MAG: hypothetical protein IPO13_03365 [Rhodocyclaceae bacterium]|nr:hypothetical protein [Rhodocyclaceae bacterium]
MTSLGSSFTTISAIEPLFHLLGFLDQFSGKYDWEPGIAVEYIARLMQEETWRPFSQEATGWKSGTEKREEASTTSRNIREFMTTAGTCANAMLEHATYIEKELRSLDIPESIRVAIREVCSSLNGTKHDVVHELGEFDDLLGTSKSKVIPDPIRRIMVWLSEDVSKLHALAKSLEALAKEDKRIGIAYLLVAESATNILHRFTEADDAADKCIQSSEYKLFQAVVFSVVASDCS